MPIIPRYNLTQISTHVSIEVSIPHVRVSTSTLELVIVDGTEVHLYAPPTYLLKLTLPDRVVDENAVEESLAHAAPAGSNGICIVETDGNCSSDVNDEKCADASSTTSRLWTKDDLPKLQYNPEKNHGTLVVNLRKEQEGLWQDLDLLGRLQQPAVQQKQENHASPTKKTTKPLVEVIDADCEAVDGDKNEIEDATLSSEVMADLLSINNKSPTYGLFQHFSNVFRDYAREGLAHEMLECPNPDANDVDDEHIEFGQLNKREMRLEMENEKFDPDRYLNDLCVEEEGDMIFDAAMMMVPHWTESCALTKSDESVENITSKLTELSTSDNQNSFFSSEESHILATLPTQNNRPVRHSPEQQRAAFLSLADVLFTYAYDHRTTDGDPTVESSWTVMILSSSLAWLENYNPPYDTVADVVRWSMRRSLIYPYLRSYALAMTVVGDVSQILKGGRRTVIRCLLQMHRIMEKSESHYLFNKLYIDPLIGWIQQCVEDEVQKFGREIEDLTIDPALLGKQSLNLNLAELEKGFLQYYEEEETTSSEKDDDDSVSYESDSDSSGVDEITSGTGEEDLPVRCQNKDKEPISNKTAGADHSAALLDENIGCRAPPSGLGNVVLGANEGSEAENGLIQEA